MYNINSYNIIAKNKKVSELFLGTLDIKWNFAKIGYTAVCTEALPLTFMEKMVCGIANLDGRVSLIDLAHIMGLNIENDVQNLKFQDMSETEILMDTLRTLKQFGVIATPDDSFSYVELTEIGKEYYAKGRKFKHGETKGFTMYFDLTDGKHSHAKSLFSKLTVDGSKEQQDVTEIPYADESFVKQYAESQIPQYYSEKTGNSFTDMSVSSSEFLYKKVVLGVIYDSSTETYRFELIDNGGIDTDYITGHVNIEENYKHYLELFLAAQPETSESKDESQIKFEEEIAKVQSDAEYAIFNEKPEMALQLVTNYAKSPEYMEKQNFFNFIKSIEKVDSAKDVFISLPVLTKETEEEIRRLSEDANLRIMLSCSDVEDFDSRFGDNILALNGDTDSDLLLITDDVTYRCENLHFSINEVNFSVEFLHKQESNGENTLEQIRELYATRFIPNALEKYEELLQETETDDILGRISELNSADELIMFADSYVRTSGNDERLATLRASRDKQLQDHVQKYSTHLIEELDNLRANNSLEDIRTLDAMEKVKKSLSDIKGKLIPEQSMDNENGWGCSGIVLALNDSISSFESQLNNRETYLRQELLPKSYIIDTNVFVHFPEIMDYIGKDDRTILSLKVLEELDKLKVTLDGKDKRNVKKAIKEINYKIRMNSKAFRMESADTRLLPEEFDKTNSDNLILSVALKYSDRNPFLITNDINFQNRSASMGIPFKGLSDLLPKDVYQSIDFSKSEKKKKDPESKKVQNTDLRNKEATMPKVLAKIMKKAYKSCKKETDEVLVAKFVTAIKTTKPDFKTNTFGYPKFKDLCEAYPSEIELYQNSNNALCIRLIDSDSEERDNSQSSNLKDIESLNNEQQKMLRELMIKMIDEEDSLTPTSDGEIRKAFIKMSGVHIKLKPVRQMRESLGIPSEKQRKSNFSN
jgi:rRNA-processing protein FCF1/ribosomal protein S7